MEDISRLEQNGRLSGVRRLYGLARPDLCAPVLGLYADDGVNRGLIVGLDIFFVVHALLHPIFYNHPENRFGSIFSYVLIFGAGAFGAIDLLRML